MTREYFLAVLKNDESKISTIERTYGKRWLYGEFDWNTLVFSVKKNSYLLQYFNNQLTMKENYLFNILATFPKEL